MIEANGEIGDCDFCSSKNLPVTDLTRSNPVSDNIVSLIQLYEPSYEPMAKNLVDSLRINWDLFNVDEMNLPKLLAAICEGGGLSITEEKKQTIMILRGEKCKN